MDTPIRPIQSQPTRPATPVHRRREAETTFHVPDHEPDDDAPSDDEAADERRHEDRPVAPRPDDEAGSHLDITG